MRILALDLSLTGTGWALADGSRFESGTLKAKLRGMERLAWILQQVEELAKGVDLVVMENFAFGAKGAAVFEIAGLGYMVRYWLWRRDIPFVLVPPSQLKKFSTGKGNAEKDIVIREVYRRWGHVADDNNAADAIVLSYIGRALVGGWEPTTAEQRDVLAQIRTTHEAELERVPALETM